MSSFKKRINANKIGLIIAFILIAFLIVSVVFAFIKIDRNEKTKTLGTSSFTYAVGTLNAEGEYEQGTSSIYTKDFYSVDGLTVDLKDDASVTYKLAFYDENKEFVSMTDSLSSDYDSSLTPETAEYFKLMITPTSDDEVTFLEINDYAGQLTVTVNK